MFRFDAKQGFYLYPEAAGEQDKKLWLNTGSTYEKNVAKREDIWVIKHGLKIPKDASGYDEFVKLIGQQEKEFVAIFEE